MMHEKFNADVVKSLSTAFAKELNGRKYQTEMDVNALLENSATQAQVNSRVRFVNLTNVNNTKLTVDGKMTITPEMYLNPENVDFCENGEKALFIFVVQSSYRTGLYSYYGKINKGDTVDAFCIFEPFAGGKLVSAVNKNFVPYCFTAKSNPISERGRLYFPLESVPEFASKLCDGLAWNVGFIVAPNGLYIAKDVGGDRDGIPADMLIPNGFDGGDIRYELSTLRGEVENLKSSMQGIRNTIDRPPNYRRLFSTRLFVPIDGEWVDFGICTFTGDKEYGSFESSLLDLPIGRYLDNFFGLELIRFNFFAVVRKDGQVYSTSKGDTLKLPKAHENEIYLVPYSGDRSDRITLDDNINLDEAAEKHSLVTITVYKEEKVDGVEYPSPDHPAYRRDIAIANHSYRLCGTEDPLAKRYYCPDGANVLYNTGYYWVNATKSTNVFVRSE